MPVGFIRKLLRLPPTFYTKMVEESSGSIREAGGAFGAMQAAKEEQYFRKKNQKQIEKLKEMLIEDDDENELETDAKEEDTKDDNKH